MGEFPLQLPTCNEYPRSDDEPIWLSTSGQGDHVGVFWMNWIFLKKQNSNFLLGKEIQNLVGTKFCVKDGYYDMIAYLLGLLVGL